MADRVVVAPRDAGIASVAAFRLELLAAMDKAGPDDTVVLDLGGVHTADSAFAQLVIAFKHEARLRNQRMGIEGEGSKNRVSTLLGCDVVCEACAFNSFKTRSGLVPAMVRPVGGSVSRTVPKTKRSKA
ncbi:MAG: STAS domain-containing protein [Spirochaetia bacterium]|nr:STAS domain-containing protein [Spirochaetia bacterium]